MTTTVTIEAHLSDKEEVVINITDDGDIIGSAVLQDGEETVFYVYNGREVHVKEVEKQ